MKKILLLILTALLVVSLSSVFISAAEAVNPDGYTFDIKEINGSIKEEIGIIITKQDAIANANLKWPIIIICQKVSDNVYKVKSDPIVPGGTVPSITLGKDEIIIAIHSSSSDVSQKDKYKNVEQKVAAMNVKTGMYFKLEGIDIAAGTVSNGKAICSSKAPDGSATTSSTATSSTAASSTAASSETSAASSAASSTAATSSAAAASSAASSVNSNVESSGVTSEMDANPGLSNTTIIIIVVAAVVVVGGIVAIILTKKKK